MGESGSDDLNQLDEADDIAALLPAYALGVLDDGERARVEAWLAGDARRDQELAGYLAVVDRLPLLADEHEPPAGLRERLLAAARADVAGPGRAAPPPATPAEVAPPPVVLVSPPRRAWYRRVQPSVLAASILLAVSLGLGVWNAILRGQVADQQRLNQQLSGQVADQQQRNQQLSGQLAASQAQVAQLEAQARVKVYTVSGTKDAPNAGGELVYFPQQSTAYLTVQNLPPPPSGRAYQVWYIRNGQPVDAGLLPTAPNQATARLQSDLGQYQAVAVSLEPAGGSQQPTGPIVVQAPIGAGSA